MAFGSQERSGGRQRRKDGTEATWNEERLKREVVMMDQDCKEKLEMEEHVPAPKRVCITREDFEVFGFTARCLRCS